MSEEKSPADKITAVLTMQADAWNKGDLEKFMEGYLKTAETSYVSSESEVWGYDALRQRYMNKYGSSKETMGKLAFTDLKLQSLGVDNALCIGHWHLQREGKPDVSGIFSLVLKRTDGGWKIIHDHTSTSS